MSDELVAFLRARLDETEWSAKAAKDAAAKRTHYRASMLASIARELRDVEAKRRIVAAYLPPGSDPHPGLPCTDDLEDDPDGELYAAALPWPDGPCVRHLEASKRLLHHDYVLRLLASVYSDHPDYRNEWRPEETA